MEDNLERKTDEEFCVQIPGDFKGIPLKELAGIQIKLSEAQDRIQDEIERIFKKVLEHLGVETEVNGTDPFSPMIPEDDDYALSFRLSKPTEFEGNLDEWKAKIKARLEEIFCPDEEPVRKITDMTLNEIAEAVMAPEDEKKPEKEPDWRNSEYEFCCLEDKDHLGDLTAVIDARRIYGAYEEIKEKEPLLFKD
jgi:hypothetical protein